MMNRPPPPKLTNWAGMLTLEGEALKQWLQLTGTPIPPAPAGSLISAAAHYFRDHPQTAAALWQAFRDAEETRSEIVLL